MTKSDLISEIELLLTKAEEFWKDETNDINDRWELFIKYGKQDNYIQKEFHQHPSKFNNYYDVYMENFEKHEGISYSLMLYLYEDECLSDGYSEDLIARYMNFIKRAIIRNGFTGFKYNW